MELKWRHVWSLVLNVNCVYFILQIGVFWNEMDIYFQLLWQGPLVNNVTLALIVLFFFKLSLIYNLWGLVILLIHNKYIAFVFLMQLELQNTLLIYFKLLTTQRHIYTILLQGDKISYCRNSKNNYFYRILYITEMSAITRSGECGWCI